MSLHDIGWECPKCGMIYAPHVRGCDCGTKDRAHPTSSNHIHVTTVAELKAEEIIKPLSPLDEMSDEQILYWATPFYDELVAQKALRDEQIKTGEDLNAND